jgi:hypothetical protein
MFDMQGIRRLLSWELLGIIAVCILFALDALCTPLITNITIGNEHFASFPVKLRTKPQEEKNVHFLVRAKSLQSPEVTLTMNTCSNTIRINETQLTRTCNSIRLSRFIRDGVNTVRFSTQVPSDGSFNLSIDVEPNSLQLFARGLALFILAWCFAYAVIILSGNDVALSIIFALGAILRATYTFVTRPLERGYDAAEHMEYVRYLIEHFRLPPATQGWEFHQPPLYYLLNAPLLMLSRLLHLQDPTAELWMQALSLSLSLCTLVITFVIARRMFRLFKHRTTQWLLLGLLATAPSLVMLSSRINNDVLYVPLAILSLLFIIRLYDEPRRRFVVLAAIAAGCAMLTKMHALILVTILLFCISLCPRTNWKRRLSWLLWAIVCIAAITSWLFLYRLLRHEFLQVFRFGSGQNSKLGVSSSILSLLTFNPITALRHLYVSPWNDFGGRQSFWLYFFKTSLFGEFTFPDIIRSSAWMTVLTGISVLPWAMVSLVIPRRYADRLKIPLLSTVLLVLLGALSYRIRYPMASNQDFRHSVLIIPPFAVLLCKCVDSLTPLLSRFVMLCIAAFILSCSVFLFAIVLAS